MNEQLRPLPSSETPLDQALFGTFGVVEDFQAGVSTFYYDHAENEDITVTREFISTSLGSALRSLPASDRPKLHDLFDRAVHFTSHAALYLSNKNPAKSQDIINFWGDVTTAIVGVEHTEKRGDDLIHLPVTKENRIYRNMSVRTRVLSQYSESLSYPVESEEATLTEGQFTQVQTGLAAD